MLFEALDHQIQSTVRRALAEDIGSGDVTANLIGADRQAKAKVICRESAVLCGCAWFECVFAELDSQIQIQWLAREGETLAAEQTLCTLQGPARAILTGERTALNLLQTLSGTATRAAQYAAAVQGLAVRVLDTRKTIPGLRLEQKYAVRIGGCHNHRLGLYDGILIKENHIAASGSIQAAVTAARALNTHLPIEVEVEDLDQVQQALEAQADILLLDNFDRATIQEAVHITAGRAKLEVSGGVTLETIRSLAETGVDFISTGALTKDIRAIDLSMRFI